MNRKKTLPWRANQAAMRTVPKIGNRRDYERALDYFKIGFARGFETARRLAKNESNQNCSEEA